MRKCHTRYLQTSFMTTSGEVIKVSRVEVTNRWFRGQWTAFTKWWCNVVTKVATGKSLISLKTTPFLQKYAFNVCSSAITFSRLFSLFQKVKSSQNCAISLHCIQNIFISTFNYCSIEHKLKTNMQRQVELPFGNLKNYILLFLILSKQSFQPQDIKFTYRKIRIHAWNHNQPDSLRLRDSARICFPSLYMWTTCVRWHSTGLNLSHLDLLMKPMDQIHQTLSPFKSCWLIRKGGAQINTDYWHP